MDNGINDIAQTMNVTINGMTFAAKATKESIKMLKNLLMLIVHAGKWTYNKKLENSKGEVSMKKMDKLTSSPAFVRVFDDPEYKKQFVNLCKKYRIPVTEMKGVTDSKVVHYLYPSEYAQKMESLMKFMTDWATKENKKKGMSEQDAKKHAADNNRTETIEEAGKDLGCDMPHEEFKQKFFDVVATPEEKQYYAALEGEKSKIGEEKKTEIEKAVAKNENRRKSNKFDRDGMYTVIFDKDQIIGTVERNNEKFVKVRFENDYSQAFLVNKKNIVKYGEKLYGAFERNGNITIYDIKNNSEKTMNFKDFIKESDEKTSTRSNERTHTKASESKSGQSIPALPKNEQSSKKKGTR